VHFLLWLLSVFVIFLYFGLFFFFFFSSRRRHTRCLSDWSSDVCSSDLRFRCSSSSWPGGVSRSIVSCSSSKGARGRNSPSRVPRSEERRVGKECRCGGWGDQ